MRRLIAAILAATVVLITYTSWRVYALAERVLDIERRLNMQTMIASWKDAQGITHEVRTERLEGETLAEQAARHSEAVAALKALFPPAK